MSRNKKLAQYVCANLSRSPSSSLSLPVTHLRSFDRGLDHHQRGALAVCPETSVSNSLVSIKCHWRSTKFGPRTRMPICQTLLSRIQGVGETHATPSY
jgi:hypothetical protein